MARLARLVSGNGTGLVLGGGGARGFAHLGVWRALRELGVEVDAIGGASIGAPLGAGMALQIPDDELLPLTAELFHDLLDYTVPVVSLVKGERITRNITKLFAPDDVRDLWLPFFCVSTNLTRSRVEVHDRGDLATAIRASVAIPGILPPVPFGRRPARRRRRAQQPAVRRDARLRHGRPGDRRRPLAAGRAAGPRGLRAVGVRVEGAAGPVRRSASRGSPASWPC